MFSHKRWLMAMGVALVTGCATPTFRPYIGQQQDWPTTAGNLVDMQGVIPAFMGLPHAPYAVLGEVRLEGAGIQWVEERSLPALAARARDQGADALMIVNGSAFFAGNTATVTPRMSTLTGSARGAPRGRGARGASPATSVFEATTAFLAIKWQNQPPAMSPAQP